MSNSTIYLDFNGLRQKMTDQSFYNYVIYTYRFVAGHDNVQPELLDEFVNPCHQRQINPTSFGTSGLILESKAPLQIREIAARASTEPVGLVYTAISISTFCRKSWLNRIVNLPSGPSGSNSTLQIMGMGNRWAVQQNHESVQVSTTEGVLGVRSMTI